MSIKFNLPMVITGRIAVNGKDQVVCLNVPKGASPKDVDKKLKDHAWEVTVGKSGEHNKTRFYLDSDKTEVDAKFVVALKDNAGNTTRYSIRDGKTDNALETPEVDKLLSAKGTKHGNDFNRKFVKIMSQGCSLLKDKKRPLTEEQRSKILTAHDKLYAEYRRLLTDTPDTSTKSNEIPDLI